MKGLFALLLAGALVVAPSTAFGNEGSSGNEAASPPSWGTLPLPPVPYIETIPWLDPVAKARTPGAPTLWPTLGLLMRPAAPPVQLSSSMRTAGTDTRTE